MKLLLSRFGNPLNGRSKQSVYFCHFFRIRLLSALVGQISSSGRRSRVSFSPPPPPRQTQALTARQREYARRRLALFFGCQHHHLRDRKRSRLEKRGNLPPFCVTKRTVVYPFFEIPFPTLFGENGCWSQQLKQLKVFMVF